MSNELQPDSPRGRGGRPSKGQRRKLSFRATEGLEKRLEEAAAKENRSISEEAEVRLQRSFSEPDLVREAVLQISAGSSKVAKLLEIIGVMARVAEARTGTPADDDPDTFETIRVAAIRYLQTASAYLTREQQSAGADPGVIEQQAEEVARLTADIFHNPDRKSLKAGLPLWARRDEGFA